MPSAAPPPAPSYSIQQLQLLQPTASAASVFDRKSYDSNNKDKHKKSFININEDEAERKHYYVHHSPAPGNNNSSRPQVPPLNLVDVPRNDQSGRKPQVRSEVWRERVTKANSDWQDRYGNISVAVVANNNTSKSGQKTKNLAWRDESGPSDGNNRLRKIHEFTHHPDEFTTTGQVIVPFLGPNGSPVSPMSDCDL